MCNFGKKKKVTNKCYNGVYEYFECKRLQNVEFTQYLLQNVVFMIAEINLANTNFMCRIKMATKMIFKDAVFTFQSQINRQFVP